MRGSCKYNRKTTTGRDRLFEQVVRPPQVKDAREVSVVGICIFRKVFRIG